MSNRLKLIIVAAGIAAILFVLISPLPEIDATAHCRVVAIFLPTAVVGHFLPLVLRAAHENGRYSLVNDGPELLAILCVRNC